MFTSMFSTINQSVHHHSKQTALGISDHQILQTVAFKDRAARVGLKTGNVLQSSGFAIFNYFS